MTKTLLVFGRFSRAERTGLSLAASEAAFDAEVFETTSQASGWLASHVPHAMVVDDGSTTRSLCIEARAEARLAEVPILALSHDLDDLSFAETFAWGGDDAVDVRELRGLCARLRSLPATAPRSLPGERGSALIADADRSRRIVIGRVLRNAGYIVQFAASEADVLEGVRTHSPALVVSSSEFCAASASIVQKARAGGSGATWIVTVPPKDLRQWRKEIEPLGNATVTDGFAPPENIVFLANELRRGDASDKRASRRLLYGTTVAFRGAGREHDEHGFAYNVSLGGLYVRTLAPPEDDVVWLELTPARCDRRVRVEGHVVWRRAFGPAAGATVPPGFGVALSDGTKRDLAAWHEGYTAFAGVLGY